MADVYEDMTVGEIITDLISLYVTDFTTTQVSCSITVSYIQFTYMPLSECIKQLADLVGYDWYVDYNRDIYFASPASAPAPVDILDNNGSHTDGSLIIRDDNSQLRTSIIVRGGEYLGTEFTASALADGKDVTFKLPYKYTDFKIRKNGVVQTVGIDYIDDPLNFDALYNFSEKLVRWRSDNKPALNSTLSFAGKPHLPVIIKYSDPVAIAAIFSAEGFGDGEYEYLINDQNINSQVGARQRAAAEVATYGETLSEGEFESDTAGFLAGQRVLINSTKRNINQYFVINKVITTMKTPTTFEYKISLITTKTMDYLAILKKMLLRDSKAIILNQNELLDLIQGVTETMTIVDSLASSDIADATSTETMTFGEVMTAQALNYAVQFVLGPLSPPSGTSRVFILDGSRLG